MWLGFYLKFSKLYLRKFSNNGKRKKLATKLYNEFIFYKGAQRVQ